MKNSVAAIDGEEGACAFWHRGVRRCRAVLSGLQHKMYVFGKNYLYELPAYCSAHPVSSINMPHHVGVVCVNIFSVGVAMSFLSSGMLVLWFFERMSSCFPSRLRVLSSSLSLSSAGAGHNHSESGKNNPCNFHIISSMAKANSFFLFCAATWLSVFRKRWFFGRRAERSSRDCNSQEKSNTSTSIRWVSTWTASHLPRSPQAVHILQLQSRGCQSTPHIRRTRPRPCTAGLSLSPNPVSKR